MSGQSANPHSERRLRSIRRWTPSLWSLRIDRPDDFAFEPGHYVRLGLIDGQQTVWRPYSVVSAPADPELEVLITLVPGGAFSGALSRCDVGAPILLEHAAFGFFLPAQLADGDVLWMLSTGSGLGPYVSLLRQGRVQQRFGKLVVVHSVRHAPELAYRAELDNLAAVSQGAIRYLPVVTRDSGAISGTLHERIPKLIEDGALEEAAGLPFEAQRSRVMVCGNPEFTAEMRRMLNARSFKPCRRAAPGSMLFENYW